MNDLKKTAKKISAAIHRHGTVSVFRDDEGKHHPLPGYDVRLVGVYSEGIRQADIEDDLNFNEEETQ